MDKPDRYSKNPNSKSTILTYIFLIRYQTAGFYRRRLFLSFGCFQPYQCRCLNPIGGNYWNRTWC